MRRISAIMITAALSISLVAPAQAETSSLSSERDLLSASWAGDLTPEQEHALRFGPTSAEAAAECAAKHPNATDLEALPCSTVEITVDEHKRATYLATTGVWNKFFGSSFPRLFAQ